MKYLVTNSRRQNTLAATGVRPLLSAPLAHAQVRHMDNIRSGKNTLLLENGKGYEGEIFAPSRMRALIYRVNFSRGWVQRCARDGAAAGAEQSVRALGPVVCLQN